MTGGATGKKPELGITTACECPVVEAMSGKVLRPG